MSRILCALIITAVSSVSWVAAEEASDVQERNRETVQQWIMEICKSITAASSMR